ncbi:DMT family transporter [Luteimonas sp. SJ-92]|uniref:DMT family transporter n=1 Tax=Luteimonas salinisoli TaxID=2752307 RepID=A0A853JDT3_9GAMM|nr:DMT family transporter [Luteimonas salinisoli]NZA26698.1 DMT family transporter [Luteimonas salinisoli]
MQQERNHDRAALLWMLAGASLIGTNGLMVRFAETPPTVSAFYRVLFGGLLLWLVVAARRDWRPLPTRAWLWVLAPATAFAADLWLWHRSILLVGPGLSTLLANVQVFAMALGGVLLYGERVGVRFLAGLLLAFFGLWLLLGGEWSSLPREYRWGVLLGLATGVCYAAYNLGLKRAQQEARQATAGAAPIAQVLALASLGCALLLGAAGVAEGVSFAIPSWRSLAWLLLLAGVGHCLSWVLISRAMPHLRVAVVGLLLLLQPVVAFVLDVALLDRATSPREWLGLALTLAGIFLAGLRGRARLPAQPA